MLFLRIAAKKAAIPALVTGANLIGSSPPPALGFSAALLPRGTTYAVARLAAGSGLDVSTVCGGSWGGAAVAVAGGAGGVSPSGMGCVASKSHVSKLTRSSNSSSSPNTKSSIPITSSTNLGSKGWLLVVVTRLLNSTSSSFSNRALTASLLSIGMSGRSVAAGIGGETSEADSMGGGSTGPVPSIGVSLTTSVSTGVPSGWLSTKGVSRGCASLDLRWLVYHIKTL